MVTILFSFLVPVSGLTLHLTFSGITRKAATDCRICNSDGPYMAKQPLETLQFFKDWILDYEDV